MFRKKKKKTCPYCGKEVDEKWNYCPYCGRPLKYVPPFEEFENFIEKQFENLDKLFGFEIPRIRFKPTSGISITITSGSQPVVRVKTSRGVKTLKPTKGVREIPVESVGVNEKSMEPPKVTEEPQTKVKHLGFKDVVEIKLPGVKSARDIQIRELEQSIEVKARAGDKLYFKLLPIPPGRTLHKKFSKDKLVLEIER